MAENSAFNIFQRVEYDGAARAYVANLNDIGGWLSRHEASIFVLVDEVQKAHGITGYLADLGVWHGRGAILLQHLRRPGEQVYAIDIFDLRKPTHSHFNDPAIFLANVGKYGPDKNVNLVKIDTSTHPEALMQSVPVSGCRLFHVDGGHEYRSVRHDMEFAASALSDGGVMVCDDVLAKKFPGVTQALIETLLAHPGLAPFAISTKKAWVSSRAMADLYRQHL